MAVQVHVFRLVERRLHRVISGCLICRIPIRHCRAGGDMQSVSLFRELGIAYGLSLRLCIGVDLSGPAWDGNSAAFNRTGGFCWSLGVDRRGNECDDGSRKGEIVEETHGLAFHDRLYMGYSRLNGAASDESCRFSPDC